MDMVEGRAPGCVSGWRVCFVGLAFGMQARPMGQCL